MDTREIIHLPGIPALIARIATRSTWTAPGRVVTNAFLAVLLLWSSSKGLAVTAEDFLRRGEGSKLPCRLYVPPAAKVGDPNYKPTTKYPLVVFLHGAGDGGDPGTPEYNNKQLINRANGAFVFSEQSETPAFLRASASSGRYEQLDEPEIERIRTPRN